MRQVVAPSNRYIQPYALILGTNEIASAVAVEMRRAGWSAVLAHDPFPPVIRRKMAFHDVLFGEFVVIDSIEGVLADDALDLLDALNASQHVVVTPLQLPDLIAFRTPESTDGSGMTTALESSSFPTGTRRPRPTPTH